jgi:methyl-accepting chemotaxis protein
MFDHLPLKTRLNLTFAAILALTSALIGVALFNNAKLRDTVHWNTHTYKVLAESNNMLLNMVNIETGLRGFVAGSNEKFLEPFNSGQLAFRAAFNEAKSLTSDNPSQQARLEKMMASHTQFIAVGDALVAMRRDATAGKVPVADLLREFGAGKDKAAMDAFRGQVAEFAKSEQDLLVVRSAALESTMSITTYTLLLGGLALFALATTFGLALARSIFRQLGADPAQARLFASEIASGRLNGPLPAQVGGSQSVMASMVTMRASLVTLLTAIGNGSRALGDSARQALDTSSHLAALVSKQSDETASIAASVEQMTVSVAQITDNAKAAEGASSGARSAAEQGADSVRQGLARIGRIGESVRDAESAMSDMGAKAREITTVVQVIRDIAEQTNLLALNAAIEAARAGEAGRGFAVVADEVRGLAERTSRSTAEIAAVVSSIQNVAQGTQGKMATVVTQVREAEARSSEVSSAIEDIAGASARVSEAVTDMSGSLEEQSTASTTIARKIEEIAQMNERSNNTAQQLAGLARTLNDLSSSLDRSTGAFAL